MNHYWYIIINLKSILYSDLFVLLNILLLFQGSILEHYGIRHYIYSFLLRLLLTVTIFQLFLVFDDLDSFQEYWVDIL